MAHGLIGFQMVRKGRKEIQLAAIAQACQLRKMERTYWHENGQMKEAGIYINGIKDGQWIEWYDNGQIKMKESYKNSQKNGKWLVWYDNGQMKIEGDYKNNKKAASGLVGILGVGILSR